MRIVVTGAEGLLGSELVRIGSVRGTAGTAGQSPEVVGLTRRDLDVTDGARAAALFGRLTPNWVIHCAAYTAVDRAEAEPEEAMRVNHGGTVNVARASAKVGARLLYLSSDYVFDGEKRTPYLPTDPVAPLSVYARTKQAGEEAAVAAGGSSVRIGWLYGAGGGNFVDGILRRAEHGESLRVVDDQRGRPTWARNVAAGLLELIGRDQGVAESGSGSGPLALKEVWHLADGGDATWLEVAREAARLRGLDVEIRGVSSEEWGAPAPRPAYSVLDLSATEAWLGRSMTPWRKALAEYLSTSRTRHRVPKGRSGSTGESE